MQSGYASKQRLTAMNPADADDFSRALTAAFPNIRFVAFQYWYVRDYIRRGPDNLVVPYFDSLADGRESMFRVWLEPEGWQPRWREPDHKGLYFLANEPEYQFEFLGSGGATPPRYENITWGRICAVFPKGDKEYLRFLGKVWRILEKLTSNVLDRLDSKTGEVKIPARRTMLWVGHHTMEWCRRDPRRRICETDRPPAEELTAKA